MSRRLALFDLDGTLTSLPVPIEEVRAVIAALFAARGWSQPMRPILATIDAAAAAVATTDAEAATLIAAARGIIDRAEVVAARDASLIDGAAEVLTTLGDRGVAVGVVTNNCAESARVALAGHSIGLVVGRDDVARPKPDPEGLLVALDRLGDGSGVWVGDRASDIAAGLAARAARPDLDLEIVGFARSPEVEETLLVAGADRVIRALVELL